MRNVKKYVIIYNMVLKTELRRKIEKRAREKTKTIHKSWVGFGTGAKAILTDLTIVLQLSMLAFIYAALSYLFPVFFYVSLALTALSAIHVFISERDPQSAASWMLLFVVSFGCGYIVYILADKRVCYGYNRRRYVKINERSKPYVTKFSTENMPVSVANDCEYIYNVSGYVPYRNTRINYFANAREALNNIIERVENAEKFVFMEFFIVADGVLLDRLINACKRKTAEGVRIYMLCDDVGCAGVLSGDAKKRLKNAGVKLKVFEKLFTLFSFGLNFRDHRKIVVIDGKIGYTGGFNFIDDCANMRKMQGFWKDSGVRLEGEAVDGLTLAFIRQWEFATKEKLDYAEFTGKYDKFYNGSTVVPYAGGPEISEALCRGVYANVIAGAREKLYIMTPYLIPDGDMLSQIKLKAQSGVDVRIVLPGVPDYSYIYRVTRSNAERLLKYGVKIYYARSEFVHSKVMLSENCLVVGSVNMDMRAFYQEFDNGVYTDDKTARDAVLSDFQGIFKNNEPSTRLTRNPITLLAACILRIVSPLM